MPFLLHGRIQGAVERGADELAEDGEEFPRVEGAAGREVEVFGGGDGGDYPGAIVGE